MQHQLMWVGVVLLAVAVVLFLFTGVLAQRAWDRFEVAHRLMRESQPIRAENEFLRDLGAAALAFDWTSREMGHRLRTGDETSQDQALDWNEQAQREMERALRAWRTDCLYPDTGARHTVPYVCEVRQLPHFCLVCGGMPLEDHDEWSRHCHRCQTTFLLDGATLDQCRAETGPEGKTIRCQLHRAHLPPHKAYLGPPISRATTWVDPPRKEVKL